MRDGEETVDKLRDQVEQYQRILHNLHEGYILVDEDANIHDVNSAYCKMVGYSREELLSMKITDVRPGMSLAYQKEFIEDASEKGSIEFETQHRRKDGQLIDLNASAAAIEKDGKIYLAGFVRNITERKELVRQLEKSEQEFKSFYDNNLGPVFHLDLEGYIKKANKAFSEVSGYSQEELKDIHFSELVAPEEHDEVLTHFQEALKGEAQYHEITGIPCTGERLLLRISSFPITVNDEIIGVFGVADDITEKRQAEKQLKASEQRFKSLFRHNPNSVYYMDLDGNYLGLNSKMEELTGYSRSELMSLNFLPLISESDLAKTQKHFEKAAQGEVQEYEITGVTKQGEEKPVRVTNFPMIIGDEIVGVFGIAEDLTERQEAEQQRRESEQRFQSLFKHNPHPVYYFDLEGNFKDVNQKLVAFTGYSRDELLELGFEYFVDEEDLERTKKHFKKATEGISGTYEISVWVHDGIKKEVLVTKFPMYVNEEITGVYGILQDITEQKRTAKQLKESEERWENLIEASPLPIQVVQNGKILYINKAGANLYGFKTSDDLIGESIYDFNTAQNKKRIQERIAQMNAGHSVESHQHSIINKKDEERFVEVHSIGITYRGEKAVQSIYRDITEQKIAKQKLKESEERWHRLVEENPKPVLITIDGDIVFINDAGVKLYEADFAEELLGKSVFDFAHPDNIKEIKKWKRQLEKHRVNQVSETKMITCKGTERFVEVHSASIIYKGEKAIQTNIYDITDRKKEEEIIQSSLKEKQVLLQEIHHRVKNNMAVISGLLELQAMNTDDKGLKNILKESQMRIYSMAMIHEKLYASKSLAAINFNEYARELVGVIMNTLGHENTDVTFRFRMDDGELNINQAIPCGLILNELVVNCYKHAFAEQNVGSILVGFSKYDSEIAISVEDNGKGLPDDFSIEQQQSLGMTIIQTLVMQLGGSINIHSGQNQPGTCFVISFTEDK